MTNETNSGGEFKPCPFCGSNLIFETGQTTFSVIRCQMCPVSLSGYIHIDELKKYWNTRAESVQLKSEPNKKQAVCELAEKLYVQSPSLKPSWCLSWAAKFIDAKQKYLTGEKL